MKAVTYQGLGRMKVKDMPTPQIKKADDMIIKVTSSAICGSDLHLMHGLIPNLPEDYVIGHEPMGIVEEVGSDVTKLKKGDRVIIPFNVACGTCFYCKHHLESQCEKANPYEDTGGFFGYAYMTGGYAGGQAEYLRVPFANFTSFRIPEDCEVEDERLVLLADALSTAYWTVDNAGVKAGDTVIVLGCGPVGLLTQKFAWMKGAKRVIAVDHIEYRLAHAKRTNQVEIIDFTKTSDTGKHLNEWTQGGADIVIDCVGMDGKMSPIERVETVLKLQGGSMSAIEIAAEAVRRGGTLQITGVYSGRYNGFPLGHFMNRNINLRMGQAPVIHYMPFLYDMVIKGEIDPGDVITHQLPLQEAEYGYQIFDKKQEGCIKVILKPS